jgi:hypothetical protein
VVGVSYLLLVGPPQTPILLLFYSAGRKKFVIYYIEVLRQVYTGVWCPALSHTYIHRPFHHRPGHFMAVQANGSKRKVG